MHGLVNQLSRYLSSLFTFLFLICSINICCLCSIKLSVPFHLLVSYTLNPTKLYGLMFRLSFSRGQWLFYIVLRCLCLLNFWEFQLRLNHTQVPAWEPVSNLFPRKLSSGRGKHLSLGGRITLLNFVLTSLSLYFLSFFKALKNLGYCRFNDNSAQIPVEWVSECNKICWISWKTICFPEEGGLGVNPW